MNELLQTLRSVDRNKVALCLSAIPGAGHLYKHHYASGFGLLLGGNVLVVFIALLLGMATFGVSLVVVPLLYIGAVAAAAYYLPDWHGHHHFLHPWMADPPEPPDRIG
jgi:hypothetical protein